MDPYEELGVARDASAETIRQAYRELIKRYHPDRHRGNPLVELAEEKVKRLNLAYHMISGAVPDERAMAAHERAMAFMRAGNWARARLELVDALSRMPDDEQLRADLRRVEALLRYQGPRVLRHRKRK